MTDEVTQQKRDEIIAIALRDALDNLAEEMTAAWSFNLTLDFELKLADSGSYYISRFRVSRTIKAEAS